jgi:lysophospholipid acyltransferase (LPLAT)-like uncharacterized protein
MPSWFVLDSRASRNFAVRAYAAFPSQPILKDDHGQISAASALGGTPPLRVIISPVASVPAPEVIPSTPPPAWDTGRYTLRQRIVLRLIIAAGYWVIRLICSTLRICVSYEDGAQQTLDERPRVASFWHSCQIPATYIFRNMGIRVMSSNSYDGEYMGRIIHKFGFVAVKGSSSRNAVRAVLGLRRALEAGWTVAFTLDGPRGPRHKVKPGPVALARSSGLPMTMFHAAVDKAWVLNTWDRLMIPVPFSRVLVRFGKLIPVPHEATDDALERYSWELQSALDRVVEFAEKNVSKVGTAEFPCS